MPNLANASFRRFARKLAPSAALLLTLSASFGCLAPSRSSLQLPDTQRRERVAPPPQGGGLLNAPASPDDASRAKYPSFVPPPAPGDISLRASNQYMPVLGVWVWGKDHLAPDGYKRPIEQAGLHSPFNLLITFLRFPDKEVVDADVHNQVRLAAEYAIAHNLALVADLDVRSARRAFRSRYPDELQQMLRIKEVRLSPTEPVEVSIPSLDLNDHYSGGDIPHHVSLSGSLVRVTSYRTSPEGIEKRPRRQTSRRSAPLVALQRKK